MPRLCSLLRGRSLASAVGVLSIIALGGCPVAQTPRTPPPSEQPQQQAPPAQQPGGEQTLPRPIPPPPTPSTTTSGPGTTTPLAEPNTTGTGGTGGGSGGGGGGTFAQVNVDGPTAPTAVNPGDIVTISYQLSGLAGGAIDKIEVIVAADADANGEPDGDPLAAVTQPVDVRSAKEGANSFEFNTQKLLDAGLLTNLFGQFVFGVRITTIEGQTKVDYAPGTVTVDGVRPTLVQPGGFAQKLNGQPIDELLATRDEPLELSVHTQDNSKHTVQVLLDPDTNPDNSNEFALTPEMQVGVGDQTLDLTPTPAGVPAGTYNYLIVLSDGVGGDQAFYATTSSGGFVRVALTSRLIRDFKLERLAGQSDRGFIMQGFNFNDLAGSAMAAVPDLDGDGNGELIVVSRYGKPFLIQNNGVGFGEAYLIYGESGRIRGTRQLNSVGRGGLDGLVFAGIRTPLNVQGLGQPSSVRWTMGMASVTVIPDMDGDEMPELVFGFPRVESISLGETSPLVQGQNNTTFPDLPGMGSLEFNAFVPPSTWNANMAQFTRGGVVIVSSHNSLLRDRTALNRKFDRVLDLHEVGQLFTDMRRPSVQPYVRELDPYPGPGENTGCEDCIPCLNCDPNNPCELPTDPNTGEQLEPEPAESFGDCGGIQDNCFETAYESWIAVWDTVLDNQAPGGFLGPWSIPAVDPPLANPTPFLITTGLLDFLLPPSDRCDDLDGDGAPDGCEFVGNVFFVWGGGLAPFPCTTLVGIDAWNTGMDVDLNGLPDAVWTGFYGPDTQVLEPIGARVLGQQVDDQFGASVAADESFLYIAAPRHTAVISDVPQLPASQRDRSGVVYQMEIRDGSPTLTQLWMEPGTRPDPNDPNRMIGLAWPFVDAERPGRVDTTMPVPHQYVIEQVGSARNNFGTAPTDENGIAYPFPSVACRDVGYENPLAQGLDASNCTIYGGGALQPGESAFYVRGPAEIVGPHEGAKISHVRTLGDVNGDGVRDFAVGSANVRLDPNDPASPVVGGIFIVYGRPTGVEGDYLLEQLTLDPSDQNRLDGVYVHGTTGGETLARVFADAGDVNGDGFADVIIGNEGRDVDGNADVGEAIVLFGSASLLSPAGGWAPADIPASRAVRFVGEHAGDLAGANVAAADVDGDGYTDLLISAPGADYDLNNDGTITSDENDVGIVYLVYGGPHLETQTQPIRLADIGTFAVPGARFIGRSAGDQAGGGSKRVTDINPDRGAVTVTSQGIARLGDIDGDGREDFAISAMLADPNGKIDAGEVYVLYGRGD